MRKKMLRYSRLCKLQYKILEYTWAPTRYIHPTYPGDPRYTVGNAAEIINEENP